MSVFIATLVVFAVAMLAMALGVIAGRRASLRRTCGDECACANESATFGQEERS